MSTQNQASVPASPSTVPAKRKRGRPRKLSPQNSQPKKPNYSTDPFQPVSKLTNPNPIPNSSSLLGKTVCGTLDGTFDSGYLITVRVSETGTVLKGLVFDPKISVPVSKDNDVAPLLPFVKRNDVNLVPDVKMVQPLQMREPGQSVTRYTESRTENPKSSDEILTSSGEGNKGNRKDLDSEITKLLLGFSEQSADKFDGSDHNGASKPGDETANPVQVSEQTALGLQKRK